MIVVSRRQVPEIEVELRRDEIDALARGAGFGPPDIAVWLSPIFTRWQRAINIEPPKPNRLLVCLSKELLGICIEAAGIAEAPDLERQLKDIQKTL
jgi:hypothetical protein